MKVNIVFKLFKIYYFFFTFLEWKYCRINDETLYNSEQFSRFLLKLENYTNPGVYHGTMIFFKYSLFIQYLIKFLNCYFFFNQVSINVQYFWWYTGLIYLYYEVPTYLVFYRFFLYLRYFYFFNYD